MATRQTGGVGMNHLTVVPENLEREPAGDERAAPAEDDSGSATDGDDAA